MATTCSDLAVANQSFNQVGLLFNQGKGVFGPQVTYADSDGPWGIVAADFDDDGVPDLGRQPGAAPRVGELLFQRRQRRARPRSRVLRGQGLTVAAADFNADGLTDLAVGGNLAA